MVMGIMVWTLMFIPKDCVLNSNDLTCHNLDGHKRAKSLVIIEFSWYLIGVTIFVVSFYLVLIKIIYREKFSTNF